MKPITIVETGTREGELSLDAMQAFRQARRVILHTGRCGCAEWLAREGIPFETLDEMYETAEDFEAHNQNVVEALLQAEAGTVYGVLSATDRSVRLLAQKASKIHIVAKNPLLALAQGAVTLVSAAEAGEYPLYSDRATLVTELNDREMASEVKLRLMEFYPDEASVFVLQPDGGLARLPLMELDRLKEYDHRSACLVNPVENFAQKQHYGFDDLMKLVQTLRDPFGGCPWDRAQTLESLKRAPVEESYEILDAIENNDENGIIEELGDTLFVVMMLMQIGCDHGIFTQEEVMSGIVEKMIGRHRHVFEKKEAGIPAIEEAWEQAKKQEKGFESTQDAMHAVARALPALVRAQKILKKAENANPQATEKALSLQKQEILLQTAYEMLKNGENAEEMLEKSLQKFMRDFSDII